LSKPSDNAPSALALLPVTAAPPSSEMSADAGRGVTVSSAARTSAHVAVRWMNC
jgi:hypothetical protein